MNRFALLFVTALGLLGWQVQANAACNNQIPESTPTSAFTLYGNGTAVHHKTGLMWMRCPLGQTWNGSTCTGSATNHTWQQALQEAANATFAGYGDWRLPSIKELSSIAERRCGDPAINATVFPNTPSSWFWSSSVAAGLPILAWGLYFDYGLDDGYGKDGAEYVRLVRGGQSFNYFTLTVAKTGSSNGTVTSTPAGINCGADCEAPYDSGTVVTLTATPASGATFAGWSGDIDCGDGKVTMTAGKTCTATFTRPVLTVTKAGPGSGTVTSTPAGINCGADCEAPYDSGTVVTLTATPAPGSTFAGWKRGSGCRDGKVKITRSKTCTATFQ